MYYDAPGLRRQSETSRVCDSLSDSSPAVSDREVSASSLEGGSPQQLIVPFAKYSAFQSSTLLPTNGFADSFTTKISTSCSSSSPRELLQILPDSVSAQDAQSSTSSRQTPSSDLSYAHQCELCHVYLEDIEQLMDHMIAYHSESSSFFCGRLGCKKFKSRKDFKRHLTSTTTHSRFQFRCRCGHRFPRKENFRNHFRERCKPAGPAIYACACSCGHLERDKNDSESRAQFEAHFEQCGKGKPGRRKRT